MRTLNVTEVAQSIADAAAPFLPGYTVIAINISGAAVTLQSSDASAGVYTTLVAVPIGEAREVVLNNTWLKLAAAGKLVLLGN